VDVLFRMLKLVLAGRGITATGGDALPDSWEAVVAEAEKKLPAEELLEVLYFQAREALDAGRDEQAREALAKASAKLDECRLWRPRFAELFQSAALVFRSATIAAETS
jgi:hypothetical protein